MSYLQPVIHDADADARAGVAIPRRRDVCIHARRAGRLARIAQMPLVTRIARVVGEEGIVRDEPTLHLAGELRLHGDYSGQCFELLQHRERIARAVQRQQHMPRGVAKPFDGHGVDLRCCAVHIKTRRDLHEHLSRHDAPVVLVVRLACFIQNDVLNHTGGLFLGLRLPAHLTEILRRLRHLRGAFLSASRLLRQLIESQLKAPAAPPIADVKARAAFQTRRLLTRREKREREGEQERKFFHEAAGLRHTGKHSDHFKAHFEEPDQTKHRERLDNRREELWIGFLCGYPNSAVWPSVTGRNLTKNPTGLFSSHINRGGGLRLNDRQPGKPWAKITRIACDDTLKAHGKAADLNIGDGALRRLTGSFRIHISGPAFGRRFSVCIHPANAVLDA